MLDVFSIGHPKWRIKIAHEPNAACGSPWQEKLHFCGRSSFAAKRPARENLQDVQCKRVALLQLLHVKPIDIQRVLALPQEVVALLPANTPRVQRAGAVRLAVNGTAVAIRYRVQELGIRQAGN